MTLQEQMHKRRDERARQARVAQEQESLVKALNERERGRRESARRTEARLLAMVEAGEPETETERGLRQAKNTKSKATRAANNIGIEAEAALLLTRFEAQANERELNKSKPVNVQARRLRHAREARETEAETLDRRALERARASKNRKGLRPLKTKTERPLKTPVQKIAILVKQDKRLSLKLRQTNKKKQESDSLVMHKELQQQEKTLRGEITLIRTQLRLLNGEA